MPAPFPINPVYTGIAIAYKNKMMIADDVLPRVPVGKEEFKYTKYKLEDGFTVPDTKVGRKSKPNEIEFDSTEITDSTEDYGLDDPIPQKDLDNAAEYNDPRSQSVENLSNIIELGREVRAANLVFNAASYAAANKQVLSGASQFSDFANSDPIGVIMNALENMIMFGNVITFGQQVWTKFRQHPDIIKATNGNSGDKGVAARQAVAELFEVEEILVGVARINASKKGQSPSLAQAWGKHISIMHRDKTANTRNGTTFGFTAQFGGRIAGSIIDPNIGLKGGERVRVGEMVKELLPANDLGYFIEDAVA